MQIRSHRSEHPLSLQLDGFWPDGSSVDHAPRIGGFGLDRQKALERLQSVGLGGGFIPAYPGDAGKAHGDA